MCGDDAAQVVNKYRLALKAGEDATWFDRERLRTVLNEVLGLWNLAWSGGSSQDDYLMLLDVKRLLVLAADETQFMFDDAVRKQPEMVDQGAWQTHWWNVV